MRDLSLPCKEGQNKHSMSISDVQAIRKHSAQHDVYNRLHSIARDMRFVGQIRMHYEDKIPVIREADRRQRTIPLADMLSQQIGVAVSFIATPR